MKRRYSTHTRRHVRARFPICAYCRQEYGGPQRQFTIDHIVPLFRGGTRRQENLVGCCAACNVAKGCRTPQEWLEELADAVRELQRIEWALTVESGVAT